MSSEAVRLEVEGQRRVGLIQEEVDPGQLDAVPLKHRAQNLSGNTKEEMTSDQKRLVMVLVKS